MTTPLKTSLNAAFSPLEKGVSIIEASAGTGKTYTIVMLVLRLITEYSFKIDEILLVTFTRAATEELADRLRSRLIEAREAIQGNAEGDETLEQWAANVQNKADCLRKIGDALVDIDRSPIFTIHSFCQRTLSELALQSGQLFDVELQPDTSNIRKTVAEDYWRKTLYSLDKRSCSIILSEYSSPEELLVSVTGGTAYFSLVEPNVPSIAKAIASLEHCFQAMAAWWRSSSGDYYDNFTDLIADGKMKKEFSDNFSQWWRHLDSYFNTRSFFCPKEINWLSDQGFKGQINGSRVRGRKKEQLVATLKLPDRLSIQLAEGMEDLLQSLRIDFANHLVTETESRMVMNNIMSYDDLILRLHDSVTGSHRAEMCRILADKYRAALIDEFQDTDLRQWQIFQSVFGAGNHFLYLIGDPKQAIYRFRGADIQSYFLARDKAARQLTLERNYRSHPAMVKAVNSLFSSKKDAFFYDESVLDYPTAIAALSPEHTGLQREGGELSGMVFCQLEQLNSSTSGKWPTVEAAAVIRRYITAEIIQLLSKKVKIVEGDSARDLRPDDIGVLVRNNSHAEEYQLLLTSMGVPAVITSRTPVFHTEECREMYSLLQAVAQPGNVELVKNAMTITWLGLTGNQLYRIWRDEDKFDEFISRFTEYSRDWQERGIMAMLNSFLENENVFVNLSSSTLMERKISNINHLLELLQQAESDNLFGQLQLIQWLEQVMLSKSSENELRLESDEEAVSIITMHGAKGLEYPVIFCPYLWFQQTSGKKRNYPTIACFEGGEKILDLGSEKYETRLAEAGYEEKAEELRLLYVAVTRAKLRCYAFWCDSSGKKGGRDSFDSSLGYLLFGDKRRRWDEQRVTLEKIASDSGGSYRLIPGECSVEPYTRRASSIPILPPREFTRATLHTDWQMTSYSALSAASKRSDIANFKADQGQGSEDFLEYASLPAGAGFGNVVHDIMEKVEFSQLLKAENNKIFFHEVCKKYGIEADIDLLAEMLHSVASAPLPTKKSMGGGLSLAQIPVQSCVKEMGFYFRLKNGRTAEVNNVLKEDRTVMPLQRTALEGYLTGFIDLIFEYDQKYFIADYKTNNLGNTQEFYDEENLVDAMQSHNYGLQLWLYSLVLHNHLKNVKQGYDHNRHFGGVFYLFVRGMEKKSGRGVYFSRPHHETLERLNYCFRKS